jgi:3-dehydroquinate synthase
MIWNSLSELKCDRKTLFINVGGGVVCDVGGFTASVFLRGIDVINIPTSLLSMVDSSVGGKTGINFAGLKNQVGSFSKPRAVFISPVWLKTLPQEEIRSGFAEMIKHAFISSSEKWDSLRQKNIFDDANWIGLIQDSVFLKNKIVNADFRDRHKRRTLNFGHTIGHALESYSQQHHAKPLRHGEAVALGMVGALYLSKELLHFPDEECLQVTQFVGDYFRKPDFTFDQLEVMDLIRSDKKNESGTINFVLLKAIGEPVINYAVADEVLLKALDVINKFNSQIAE